MGTTTQLKVMKNMPYQLRARADGKWDLTSNQTFTADGESVSLSMTAYNGLGMSYEESYQSADKVDFSNTVLPWKWQYSTALSTDRYCLMPVGQNYDNVTELSINANFIGSPSINYKTGVASGFSSSNYLTIGTFNPSSSSWEVVVKFTTSDNLSTYQMVFNNLVSYCGVAIYVQNGKLFAQLTGSTSSVNIELHTLNDISQNKTYWVKIIHDSTQIKYTSSYSEDGQTWVEFGSTTSANTITGGTGGFGVDHEGGGAFQGSIDLTETYININGQRWWIGAEEAKETLPGCTYNFTDDGSATTLNCFAVNGDEGIVLTPDNSYGTSRLLGTVSIPSHTVYTYEDGTWTEANNA